MVLDLREILEISIFFKTIGFYNENGHQRDLQNHQKINNVKKTIGFWWFWTFVIRKSPAGAPKWTEKVSKTLNLQFPRPPGGGPEKNEKTRNPSKQQKNIEFLILLKIFRKRDFPPGGAGRAQKVKKIWFFEGRRNVLGFSRGSSGGGFGKPPTSGRPPPHHFTSFSMNFM